MWLEINHRHLAIASTTRFYDASSKLPDHDTKAAIALLDEAELKPNAQGVRFTMRHLTLPYGEVWTRLAGYIRGALKPIGIEVVLTRARAMRRNATPAEAMMWQALRSGQLADHKARRQVPLGPFFADFSILAKKLVIEIEGDSYATEPGAPERRTACLNACGWQVIRFTNAEVRTNLEGVLMQLLHTLNPHPNPLPTGEGALEPSPIGRGQGEGRQPLQTPTP